MTADSSSTTVLVTGASGFVAQHCIVQLLEQGYRVRGTLRTLSREAQLRTTLGKHVDAGDRLELVCADLLRDEGWDAAVGGCDFVLHTASPHPLNPPTHEDDLIVPAREGTLRVLRAAASGGVKRVVLTSSMEAIREGYEDLEHKTFTEADWTRLDGHISAYMKSKTLAERAAWDFATQAENKQRFELAVINPGLIFGPVLDGEYRTSSELIRKLMRRELPGVPRVMIPLVDVRDVATAHLAAMTIAAAAGQRFCCVGAICSIKEIAQLLQRHFATRGYRIPTRELPDFLIRVFALFDSSVRQIVDVLNKPLAISTERIRTVLGWQPRPAEEAVVSMAESLIEYGLI
jgi:dihydroflavonol-4-reductase